MKIGIYSDIVDPTLRSKWETLEIEADAFPQHRWHWCSTWWKWMGESRKPHIIVVCDEHDRCIGVAPFFEDTLLGFRYLRSLPQNFGDFFGFLVSPEVVYEDVAEAIIEYLQRFSTWSCVVISPVNSASALGKALHGRYPATLFSENVVTSLGFNDMVGYLGKLRSKHRVKFKKRLSNFEAAFIVESQLVKSKEIFLSLFEELRSVQDKRSGSSRPARSENYMKMIREAYSDLFDKEQMCLLTIRADKKLIAYRLGFIHGRTFYDWNTNYNQDYAKYSPGSLSIAYLMESLGVEQVDKVDFMAGAYDYKLSYSPDPQTLKNRLYTISSHSLRGRFLSWYFLEGRDKLKTLYRRIRKS